MGIKREQGEEKAQRPINGLEILLDQRTILRMYEAKQ